MSALRLGTRKRAFARGRYSESESEMEGKSDGTRRRSGGRERVRVSFLRGRERGRDVEEGVE